MSTTKATTDDESDDDDRLTSDDDDDEDDDDDDDDDNDTDNADTTMATTTSGSQAAPFARIGCTLFDKRCTVLRLGRIPWCPARSQDPFSYILLPFDAALGPICLACLGPAGQTGTPTSIVLFILLPACGYGCLPVQVSCINSNKPVPKGQKYAFLRTKRTPACSVLFSFK